MSLSAAQLALTDVLRQRLAAAGCARGRFEVSPPDSGLSLSGQMADGKTFYFWEFSPKFHQLVDAYVQEQYDEHTAHLTIQLEIATGQAQHLRTPKPALATAPTLLLPDPTPYGLTLAAQVAASLERGATLVPSHRRGYGGMGLAGGGAGYHYGEVWDGALSPSRTFPSWAAFVAWLAAQSDLSLAGPKNHNLGGAASHPITRQRLGDLVQRTPA